MEISARNILKGKVESVEKGQVMASIKINVTDPPIKIHWGNIFSLEVLS